MSNNERDYIKKSPFSKGGPQKLSSAEDAAIASDKRSMMYGSLNNPNRLSGGGAHQQSRGSESFTAHNISDIRRQNSQSAIQNPVGPE